MSKKILQGMRNNTKFTFSAGDTSTRAVYNQCRARHKELVTLNTLFSVGYF